MRRVWPPETRREKNGKGGLRVGEAELRAETRRGVSACACMWCTPTKGICQAIARPLAVSRPVKRLERMPGPRVTEMRSGLSFWEEAPSKWSRALTVMVLEDFLGGDGRLRSALFIKLPRLVW